MRDIATCPVLEKSGAWHIHRTAHLYFDPEWEREAIDIGLCLYAPDRDANAEDSKAMRQVTAGGWQQPKTWY